jgi:hypothetical protein
LKKNKVKFSEKNGMPDIFERPAEITLEEMRGNRRVDAARGRDG